MPATTEPADVDAQPDGLDPDVARRPRKRGRWLLVIAIAVLAIDLATKLWAVAALTGREPLKLLGGALYLTLVRNSGAAFSLGTNFTAVITIIMIAVVCGILVVSRKVASTAWAWALGLILGGALGNLVDRLFRHPGPFRGAVIDFFSLFDPYGRVFAIFNVADIAIVSGGILAGLLAVLGRDLDGRAMPGDRAGAGADEQKPEPM